MAYFGGILFANVGGGGGQNYLQLRGFSIKGFRKVPT